MMGDDPCLLQMSALFADPLSMIQLGVILLMMRGYDSFMEILPWLWDPLVAIGVSAPLLFLLLLRRSR